MGKDKKEIQLERNLESLEKDCHNPDYITAVESLFTYYNERGSLQKSIEYAEQLKDLHEEAGRYDKQCITLNLLGRIYTVVPDLNKALDYLTQALVLARETGNKIHESFILTNLGLLQRKLDKLDESLETHFKAKEIIEDIINSSLEQIDRQIQAYYFQILDQIGVLYSIMNQPEKALKYMELSLAKAREAKNPNSIYSSLINLGVYYSETDSDKSLPYYLEAIPYVEQSGQKQMLSVVYNNIGGVYEDKGNYDQALTYYFKALDHAEQYEYKDYILFFNKHIGNVYFKQKKYQEALNYVEKSLSLARKYSYTSEEVENYQLLSKIHRSMDNYQAALEYSDKYIELKERSLSSELKQRIEVLQEKYEKTRQELHETREKNSLISDVFRKRIKLDFIGCSKEIHKVYELANQAALTPNSNILITGESGTGKEIIANIIHFSSSRKDNMLIAVNCGSIPEHLMESAFLGHKKGSFTGAIANELGYLNMADKGTLFLDEIGDMPLNLQIKLLRVLETRIFSPIGSFEEIKSDFRLITATNKNIEELIDKNQFRVDLFYRINTIEIHIPPLRDRREDILPLTEHFISLYAHLLNKPVPKLGNGVIQYLESYSFPGNVRELKNMMERVMIILKGNTIYIEDLDQKVKHDKSPRNEEMRLTTLAEMEETMIRKALKASSFNISQAAKLLGIHYTTLNRKLKNLEISKEYK